MNDKDHTRLALADVLSLIGELEHVRRHAIRSAYVTKDAEKKVHYEMVANKAQDIRRDVMQSLEVISDEDWCLVKSAATIRQLVYEIGCKGEKAAELEQMVDQIYTQAFGQDMSGCKSCIDDKNNFSENK